MRAINIVGAWVILCCAFTIAVLNVTWEQPFVERACEPRPEPLPGLCTVTRALTDDQWRSPVVVALLAVWVLAAIFVLALRIRRVIWSVEAWRALRAAGTVSSSGGTPRRVPKLLPFRRRIVMTTFVFLAALSFSGRRGAYGAITQPVGPVCAPGSGGVDVCETTTVVVLRTVVVDAGMSSWPQLVGWVLFAMMLCWWLCGAATDSLERRFRQEQMWDEAHRMRDGAFPGYPNEQ